MSLDTIFAANLLDRFEIYQEGLQQIWYPYRFAIYQEGLQQLDFKFQSERWDCMCTAYGSHLKYRWQ